jgi:hypothetical protein
MKAIAPLSLKARLEQLGNWRQSFVEATDCRDDVEGLSLQVHVAQLATPSRPQSEVKMVYFALHASGDITIEDEKQGASGAASVGKSKGRPSTQTHIAPAPKLTESKHPSAGLDVGFDEIQTGSIQMLAGRQ